MNFLSHYYFEENLASEYELCGIMVPDLWRGFAKEHNRKIKPFYHSHAPIGPFELEIENGIKKHYAADDTFHNSRVFKRYTSFLEEEIRSESKTLPHRLFFLGHILFELLLDRYLTLKNPNLIDNYFSMLHKVNENALVNYFTHRNMENGLADFLFKFRHLKKNEYIRQLAKPENLAIALNRICQMSTKELLLPDFVKYIEQNADKWNQKIACESPEIFIQIKQ